MNSIKIYTAVIEKELATEVLSGYDNCGVDIDITDNDQILEIKFHSINGYILTQKRSSEIKNTVMKRLGQNVINNHNNVQEALVELLKARKLKLATAESCTSGLISSKITQISGASEVFHYGLSAYSNDIKINALNVQESVIEKYGAVSSQTAASMAIGAMRSGDADIGLSITGVAGPDKSEGKPVGLIYIGLCDKAGLWVLKLELNGNKYNREEIRERAANIALDFVRRYLSFENFGCDLYRGEDSDCTTIEQLTGFSIDASVEYPIAYNDSVSKTVALSNIQDTFGNFFDSTKSTTFGFIRKLISWILVILTLVFTIKMISFFSVENNEISLNKAILREYHKQSENNNKYYINKDGIFEMFSGLKSYNDDFFAWVCNSNSDINSAVMKSEKDNYYLSHNFNKKPSSYGLIAIDSDCTLNNSIKAKNIILYGKNNSNGLAFGNLDKYLDLTYYKNNPTIQLVTLNTKKEYVIFAVAKIDINDGFKFDKSSFANNNELFQYLDDINTRSLYSTNIISNHENDYLTLITDYGNTETLVVFARALTDNEQLLNMDITITMNPSK